MELMDGEQREWRRAGDGALGQRRDVSSVSSVSQRVPSAYRLPSAIPASNIRKCSGYGEGATPAYSGVPKRLSGATTLFPTAGSPLHIGATNTAGPPLGPVRKPAIICRRPVPAAVRADAFRPLTCRVSRSRLALGRTCQEETQ